MRFEPIPSIIPSTCLLILSICHLKRAFTSFICAVVGLKIVNKIGISMRFELIPSTCLLILSISHLKRAFTSFICTFGLKIVNLYTPYQWFP